MKRRFHETHTPQEFHDTITTEDRERKQSGKPKQETRDETLLPLKGRGGLLSGRYEGLPTLIKKKKKHKKTNN